MNERQEARSAASKHAAMAGPRIISLDLDDRVRALERVRLLDGCPRDALTEIAERAHIMRFSDGDVIVPEGEEGLGFYVILGGEARVFRHGVEVAVLRAGDFFGEVALLEGTVRTATVVASGSATTCLGIVRSFFRPLLVNNPRLALRILDEEMRRVQESEARAIELSEAAGE